jgi:hypothetical protein
VPKYSSNEQETDRKLAKKSFEPQVGREIRGARTIQVAFARRNFTKNATAITIEPYQKHVQDGIDLAEQILGSGYFSGITRIVVQQGNTHHYGQVISDDPNTIYISAGRIEQEFNSSPINRAFQMASTLCHEMGHIKSKFQGGEGPADAEEHKFRRAFDEKTRSNPKAFERFTKESAYCADIVRLAHSADTDGDTETAEFLDAGLIRNAAEQIDAEKIIQGVASLIVYMVSRVSPEHRSSFKNSVLMKIQQISTDLSQKNKNPSAGIGAVFGLLKNLLSGLDPTQISYIIGQIVSRSA